MASWRHHTHSSQLKNTHRRVSARRNCNYVLFSLCECARNFSSRLPSQQAPICVSSQAANPSTVPQATHTHTHTQWQILYDCSLVFLLSLLIYSQSTIPSFFQFQLNFLLSLLCYHPWWNNNSKREVKVLLHAVVCVCVYTPDSRVCARRIKKAS